MRTLTLLLLLCMLIVLCPGMGVQSAAAQSDEDDAPACPGGGTFTTDFAPYEPIYLSVGWRDETNAKFQLSFKYRLAEHLYFGYTQTSVWDLGETAFRDSSYKPAVFYHFNQAGPDTLSCQTWFGMLAGFEHESNGRPKSESRSLNVLFVRPIFTLGSRTKSLLRIAPKVWFYTSSSGNPDIEDYRGYADLLIIYDMIGGFSFLDGVQISTSLRKGTEKHFGSIQVDLTYPVGPGYAHAQYFTGWGETILHYNERFKYEIRVGYMLVRW